LFMPYLASLVKKGVLRLPGGGRQKLTLTHVDNVVRAALACLDVSSAAGPFNIGDPTPYQLKGAVVTHFARMGYEQVVIDTPAPDLAAPALVPPAPPDLHAFRQPQGARHLDAPAPDAVPVPLAGAPVRPRAVAPQTVEPLTVAPDAASGSARSRHGGCGLSVG